jgi:hypothetical protein
MAERTLLTRPAWADRELSAGDWTLQLGWIEGGGTGLKGTLGVDFKMVD